MNEQLKLQWQEEFEAADIKTVRQMLSQEPGLVNVRIRQRRGGDRYSSPALNSIVWRKSKPL